MVREVQLIGGAYKDNTLTFSAQDTVNWLPVPAEAEGARSAIKLRGLPGCSAFDGEVTPFTDGEIFLLHYNGENGSTAFPDSGTLDITWTRTQDTGGGGVLPVVSTAQSKFGGSSGFFDHSTSVIGRGGFLLSNTISFLTATDWTYETFVYNTGGSIDNPRPIGFFTSGSFTGLQLNSGAGTSMSLVVGESIRASGIAVPANTWVHIAFQRRGTTNYDVFVNGAFIGTYTSSFVYTTSTAVVGLRLRGYLDETRFTLNEARYPLTGFTPPTAPFPPP